MKVSLSVGIAEVCFDSMHENMERVSQRADEALYQAKRSGRNRTVVHDFGKNGGFMN